MFLHPVTSSTVDAIGYDPSSRTLQVSFRNGGVYDYFSVPDGVFRAFLDAPSKGGFHARSVKGV